MLFSFLEMYGFEEVEVVLLLLLLLKSWEDILFWDFKWMLLAVKMEFYPLFL